MWTELWTFFAGLGLFLLGMQNLEAGLKTLAGRQLKHYLRSFTRHPLSGVVAGLVATVILQSSSLVGLFVLAFVGAGILRLQQALGIIFGSNLGTTFTGWLIAILGFKFNLGDMSLPLLAIGSLLVVFGGETRRYHAWGLATLGISFLLLGLGYMKTSTEILASTADLQTLQGYPLAVYFFAALVFTAIIQSSSATMMILLSGLHSDIITLEIAAVMAIGADLGTTSTLLLGGLLKSSAAKQRVALAHLFFNLGTDILALFLLKPLLYILQVFMPADEPLLLLVAFHSAFNLVGLCIFIPLIKPFANFLEKITQEKQHIAARHIASVPTTVTDTAIDALHRETLTLLQQGIKLYAQALHEQHHLPSAFLQHNNGSHKDFSSLYNHIKEVEGEALAYIFKLQQQALSTQETIEITQLQQAIRQVTFSSKSIKDVRHNLNTFYESDKASMQDAFTLWRETLTSIIQDLITEINSTSTKTAATKHGSAFENGSIDYQQQSQVIQHHLLNQENINSLSDIELTNTLNVNLALFNAIQALYAAWRLLQKIT